MAKINLDTMQLIESILDDAIKRSGNIAIKTKYEDTVKWHDSSNRIVARARLSVGSFDIVARGDVIQFIDGLKGVPVNISGSIGMEGKVVK